MKKFLLALFIVAYYFTVNAQYTKLLDFAGTTNGSIARGSLISDGTFLYAMTTGGGTNSLGTIFKIMPNGTGYVKLMDFAGATNGSYPYGSLISDGTFLYGLTANGGTSNMGTIFKIMPNGTGYVKLMDFAGAVNGQYPRGSLIFDGIFLYGMTQSGGTNNFGTIFKIMPNGTGYVKLMDFAGAVNGRDPWGSLIFDGTFLYGITGGGGTNSLGTIFKIMPNGTGYVKLMDFAGAVNGSYPKGSLISDGTFLYGMTTGGGTTNRGTIFKIMPNGTGYVKLMDFAGVANGSSPQGSLISDGTFLYGTTDGGGTNNMGTVFKYQYSGITNITENNEETDFTIYPNPGNGEFSIQATGGSGNGLYKSDSYRIEIYNVLGKMVYQTTVSTVGQMFNGVNSKHETVNLSSEPNGIYFINIKTEKGTTTKKIIINK